MEQDAYVRIDRRYMYLIVEALTLDSASDKLFTLKMYSYYESIAICF